MPDNLIKIRKYQGIYYLESKKKRFQGRPVTRKYYVLTEIIDIFTQACEVCIHDEDLAETDFEHIF